MRISSSTFTSKALPEASQNICSSVPFVLHAKYIHVEGIDQNFQITETAGYKVQMNDCCDRHPEEIVAQFLNSLIKFGPRSTLHSTFP